MCCSLQNLRFFNSLFPFSGQCCKTIPFRVWIAVMVFLSTYVNYTTRVNMSISIVSMTGGRNKTVAKCLAEEERTTESTLQNVTTTLADVSITILSCPLFPDYLIQQQKMEMVKLGVVNSANNIYYKNYWTWKITIYMVPYVLNYCYFSPQYMDPNWRIKELIKSKYYQSEIMNLSLRKLHLFLFQNMKYISKYIWLEKNL